MLHTAILALPAFAQQLLQRAASCLLLPMIQPLPSPLPAWPSPCLHICCCGPAIAQYLPSAAAASSVNANSGCCRSVP